MFDQLEELYRLLELYGVEILNSIQQQNLNQLTSLLQARDDVLSGIGKMLQNEINERSLWTDVQKHHMTRMHGRAAQLNKKISVEMRLLYEATQKELMNAKSTQDKVGDHSL